MKTGSKSIKTIVVSLVLILALIAVFFILYKNQERTKVCFEDDCFSVEIAKTNEEKSKGLMFRDLEENKGMLFVYDEEGIYSFWMKNAIIPLDMVWVNSDFKIVHIKNNALPCDKLCESIIPEEEAQYILEINGGKASELGLEVGDEVKINI